jgi:hypothetical protein
MTTFRSRSERQEAHMDIEALRNEYLNELKAEQAAAEPPPTAESVADYAASEHRDDTRMCQMIAALELDKETYPQTVRTLLTLLGDRNLGPIVRLAALRQLGSAEFHVLRFAPFHAEFIGLLRGLALDEDREVREAALERLTLTNDPEALKLLREGLEKLRKPLLPAAKAVQLLARDDHGSAVPIFRELAANAVGRVREEALRALANDPKSASLFEALAANKEEKGPIRHIAALNLKNTSADRFAKLARKLALDDDDDDKLRAAAVSAITHTAAVAEKVMSPRFAKALDAVGATTTSRALKSSIGRFSRLLGK